MSTRDLRSIVQRFTAHPGASDFLNGHLTIDVEKHRWSILVDITEGCNLGCTFCSNSPKVPKVLAADALLELLVTSVLPHASDVALGCRHEAMLHPELPALLAALSSERIQGQTVLLVTAGTLLEPQLSKAIVDSGLSFVLFSIESTHPETYAALRPPATWPALRSRLQTFMSIPRGPRPRVGAQSVLQRRVLPHVVETLRDLADLGFSRFNLSTMLPLVPASAADVVDYEGAQKSEIDDTLSRLRRTAESCDVQLTHPVSPSEPIPGEVFPLFGEGRIWGEQRLHDSRHTVCAAPWFKLRLDQEGYAYPCQLMMSKKYAWGNILTDDFDTIVNGAEAVKTRSELLAGRAPNHACARCVFGPNHNRDLE
jgi:radical SAM protein with 4Fe4S-binding SPASM domain